MQILKMIEEGKISASEGATLLKALAEGSSKAKESAETRRGTSQPRWFRVRVTEASSGRSKVNVNIPMGLVNVGLRMGARFVPEIEDSEYASLIRDIQSGRQGKVLDITGQDGQERVEIFVE
jgi:hypothetical protein